MEKNKKLKRVSLINIITGYACAFALIILIILNKADDVEDIQISEVTDDPVGLFVEKNETEKEVVYIDRPAVTYTGDHRYVDRLDGIVLDNDPGVIIRTDTEPHIAVVRNSDHVIVDGRDNTYDRINTIDVDRIHDRVIGGGDYIGSDTDRGVRGIRDQVGGDIIDHRNRGDRVDVVDDVDVGLLDRRLAELDRSRRNDKTDIGLDREDNSIDFGGLTLAREGDEIELGDLEDIPASGDGNKKGYGIGKGGQLYAYNFPSRGVGAGIGNSAIGAGAGGGAGLGAGIGQGVLNGETVPTLGGVGTYSSVPIVTPGTGTDTDGDGLSAAAESALGTDPTKPDSDGDGYVDGAEIEAGTSPRDSNSNPGIPGSESLPSLGGSGGLVGGAGAGGAAGLTTGMVKEKIGIGVAPGGGCKEHGGACDGHHGHGHANYDHLPKDGALHIMMHVDGSGSILNTRKQLDIMKETLLKTALLPYYNNDEDLYNRRVTIVDGSGERTLKFFTAAAKKDNVLAVVFQDEAQPAYHLPNFNKKPEEHYLDDLGKLKASLNGYGGVYRGVMFQVDRGKTFAKSFKEFVGNAFRGEGYLKSSNLKKFYRDNNNQHIRNRDGVVFSDEYHAKDAGDPKYYLDLIFNASKKVGLDLDIYGAGLTDGRYNKKTD